MLLARVDGFDIVADADEVGDTGEAFALLAGVPTYSRHSDELALRWPFYIAKHAGRPQPPRHVEHRCDRAGAPPVAEEFALIAQVADYTPPAPDDTPPF